ncbi:hypothetical protein ACFORL_06495 [Legionella dresdenensis]|uniref:NHL repeat protein n=1 Tax=Legionella dresdenensis TaxID=450200 RepID=A0ABV8CEH7_9GAMM
MRLFAIFRCVIFIINFMGFMAIAQAGIPVWEFVTNPVFPPQVTVNHNATVTVQYTLINHSKKPHRLLMQPITGIYQLYPCVAQGGGTCELVLNIVGSELPATGWAGGPVLCEAGDTTTPNANQCYQPSPDNSLLITVATEPPVVLASITVSGSPLSMYIGYPSVSAPARSLTITNTSFSSDCFKCNSNITCRLV